ncbi:hypothetical protein SEA_SADLAD_97 [Microbacterium phage SadLad]|nr:hypothetical protein SEA_SADLAD_97 [Microbacterium phage SadLad]
MKHPGPLGAPCAGCGRYLTMRSAQQRAAAHRHRNTCRAYQRYITERRAS